jgi:hypothetical protein
LVNNGTGLNTALSHWTVAAALASLWHGQLLRILLGGFKLEQQGQRNVTSLEIPAQGYNATDKLEKWDGCTDQRNGTAKLPPTHLKINTGLHRLSNGTGKLLLEENQENLTQGAGPLWHGPWQALGCLDLHQTQK